AEPTWLSVEMEEAPLMDRTSPSIKLDPSRPITSTISTPHVTFLQDLANYQPLGTLALPSASDANLCDDWQEYYPELVSSGSLKSHSDAQNVHKPIWVLLRLGWVRTLARIHPLDRREIQVRVYILPADVGGKYIDRQDSRNWEYVRKVMRYIDLSRAAWEGTKDPIESSFHNHASTPGSSLSSHDSLFYIFNTLPSPAPSYNLSCPFSSHAIDSLLINTANIPGLRTKLYAYQKRSAAMMIKREAEPIHALDPRLEEIVCPAGGKFFYDRTTGLLFRHPRRYDEARGGILAETMGLGKTLICLATILATKGHWPQIPPEYSLDQHSTRAEVGSLVQMAAAAANRERIPWKDCFPQDLDRCRTALEQNAATYIIPPPESRRSRRPTTISPGKTIRICAATLIVVPPNLVSHWKTEIATHVKTDALKVLYLDDEAVWTPLRSNLLLYDIVLMSKPRLVEEMSLCSCTDLDTCSCSTTGQHSSPFKDFHFLRIIVDEGHNFSTFGRRNNAVSALAKLHVERRWIVSGTPSSGLLGVEASTAIQETLGGTGGNDSQLIRDILESRRSSGFEIEANTSVRKSAIQQELKDLEKLGSIVVDFLSLKPWSNLKGNDAASWKQYIMPADGGQRKPKSLASVLESLVVRHRIEDIEKDIKLPPLHNRTVYLEPTWHDKLSLNLFILNLAVNAVTSERIDQDYMFNSKNRASLNQLIANLRHSGFYWTGFTKEEVTKSIDVSRKYLENKLLSGKSEHESGELRQGDFHFLERAMLMGKNILASPSWIAFSAAHELGLYIDDFPKEGREAWSLCRDEPSAPLIMGASQVSRAQHYVDTHLYAPDPASGLASLGQSTMDKLWQSLQPELPKAWEEFEHGHQDRSPTLKKQSPEKTKNALISTSIQKPVTLSKRTISLAKANPSPRKHSAQNFNGSTSRDPSTTAEEQMKVNNPPALKSAMKSASIKQAIDPIDPSSVLSKTRISGTSSAKLSYLLDRVISLHDSEKILIFYEGDNIAYYVAQALELLGIQYLIYTGSLSADRKSAYVATFNTTETFRVLLMDVHQAAHGLHIAAASRVFFVNPVWQPAVEAQAIKRAHRIGQTKPVYVETLVLKDTLEDRMLQRRKNMSAQEHHKAEKSLLDDDVMAQLIKDADFLPLLPEEMKDVRRQMAPLKEPQKLFGRVSIGVEGGDPDKDLIFPEGMKGLKERKRKRNPGDDVSGRRSLKKGKKTTTVFGSTAAMIPQGA
ncbi:MAG: hypothetical protein Q9199_007947, partial [Rusavskia elegans]